MLRLDGGALDGTGIAVAKNVSRPVVTHVVMTACPLVGLDVSQPSQNRGRGFARRNRLESSQTLTMLRTGGITTRRRSRQDSHNQILALSYPDNEGSSVRI